MMKRLNKAGMVLLLATMLTTLSYCRQKNNPDKPVAEDGMQEVGESQEQSLKKHEEWAGSRLKERNEAATSDSTSREVGGTKKKSSNDSL